MLLRPFLPASVMAVGSLLLIGVDRQKASTLLAPLDTITDTILGYRGIDRKVSVEEQRVAGMSSYILREFARDSAFAFSIYVGYYDQQTAGRSIHSPRNCLPGAGWEPMEATYQVVRSGGTDFKVRRYLLAKDTQRALVYYWYQGRGRVASNEYGVKFDLLRDAATAGRSEEALVRIVLPLSGPPMAADSLATDLARALIPRIQQVLPAFPGRRL